MGGAVGLKGTDGESVLAKAREMGAKPQSGSMALRALRSVHAPLGLLTGPGPLGMDIVRQTTLDGECVDIEMNGGREDTLSLCKELLERDVGLILFCGGDGTARDVLEAVADKVPILGIPAGVKMYSAVFLHRPEDLGELMGLISEGRASWSRREILDIDEDRYRYGELDVHLYGEAIVPYAPGMVQAGKESRHGVDEDEETEEVAQYCVELMQPGVVYFIGPGSGTKAVMRWMGLCGTLLGFDIVQDGRLLQADANAEAMESYIRIGQRCVAVLGIIGGQGFLIGRGNRQLTPSLLQALGKEGLMVLAPPHKLQGLDSLKVDSGSPETDALLGGYLRVLHLYGRMKLVPVR